MIRKKAKPTLNDLKKIVESVTSFEYTPFHSKYTKSGEVSLERINFKIKNHYNKWVEIYWRWDGKFEKGRGLKNEYLWSIRGGIEEKCKNWGTYFFHNNLDYAQYFKQGFFQKTIDRKIEEIAYIAKEKKILNFDKTAEESKEHKIPDLKNLSDERVKYYIDKEEITDKEKIAKLTTEIIKGLHKLHKTEVPEWIGCSMSGFGTGHNSYGYLNYFTLQRSSDIIKRDKEISQIIKYQIIHKNRKENKEGIIKIEIENEPKNCWVKDEFFFMYNRYSDRMSVEGTLESRKICLIDAPNLKRRHKWNGKE